MFWYLLVLFIGVIFGIIIGVLGERFFRKKDDEAKEKWIHDTRR